MKCALGGRKFVDQENGPSWGKLRPHWGLLKVCRIGQELAHPHNGQPCRSSQKETTLPRVNGRALMPSYGPGFHLTNQQPGTFGNSPSWCGSETKELRHEKYGHLSCSWRRCDRCILCCGCSAANEGPCDAAQCQYRTCSTGLRPIW